MLVLTIVRCALTASEPDFKVLSAAPRLVAQGQTERFWLTGAENDWGPKAVGPRAPGPGPFFIK